jgi:hypothetical protein
MVETDEGEGWTRERAVGAVVDVVDWIACWD